VPGHGPDQLVEFEVVLDRFGDPVLLERSDHRRLLLIELCQIALGDAIPGQPQRDDLEHDSQARDLLDLLRAEAQDEPPLVVYVPYQRFLFELREIIGQLMVPTANSKQELSLGQAREVGSRNEASVSLAIRETTACARSSVISRSCDVWAADTEICLVASGNQ